MEMRCTLTIAALLVVACSPEPAGLRAVTAADGTQWRQMEVKRLPDLNIPRSSHVIRVLNGEEITVFGGHTTGFIPTPTAEYFENGSWRIADMIYTHDVTLAATLPSGEVFLAGGSAEPFGVGQTFGTELYSPVSHSFSPLPILDTRRARGTAAVLSDRTTVIAGNWYRDDAISVAALPGGAVMLKEPAQGRTAPHILQTSEDNAVIFSACGVRGELLDIVVDRLHGDAFEEPLLKEWRPVIHEDAFPMEYCFIGDESLGGYAHLFTVESAGGQAAVMKLVGEKFSLLDMQEPLPAQGPDGDDISWLALMACRGKKCAYVPGISAAGRLYVCTLSYGESLKGGKASAEYLYADIPDGCEGVSYALLPGGRIVLSGGYAGDNYHPLARVCIVHTEAMPRKAGFPWWTVLPALLLIALALILWRKNRSAAGQPSAVELRSTDLMTRIRDLMEKDQLFKRGDLRLADVAQALGTNVTYISACINGQAGCSFTDFVNDYRVEYAKEILRSKPGIKISAVGTEAGFSSEASFFRNFKDRTGLSPAEWISKENR